MIVLDTSVLIRFFTGDDKNKAAKARRLLESENEFELLDCVIQELVFTLIKVYGASRGQVISALQFLAFHARISLEEKTREALKLYEENNISITDCLVVAYGRGHKIASFDEKILKFPGAKSAF